MGNSLCSGSLSPQGDCLRYSAHCFFPQDSCFWAWDQPPFLEAVLPGSGDLRAPHLSSPFTLKACQSTLKTGYQLPFELRVNGKVFKWPAHCMPPVPFCSSLSYCALEPQCSSWLHYRAFAPAGPSVWHALPGYLHSFCISPCCYEWVAWIIEISFLTVLKAKRSRSRFWPIQLLVQAVFLLEGSHLLALSSHVLS
jgi:hypothetical protein